MSKENNRDKVRMPNFDGAVYIRGMNNDQKEIFKSQEKVLGMSPSQALVNELQDRLLDPVSGESFSKKLNRWLDIGESQKTEGEMKTLLPWLQTVVEKSLLDVDQKTFRKGEESIIDWDNKKNMNSYFNLVANMEDKWKAVNLLGARNVEVNLGHLDNSHIEDGELLAGLKNTFGEIGDVIYDIAEKSSAVARSKAVKVALPITMALSSLTACVGPKITPTEISPENTPVFKVTPMAGTEAFSVLFTPDNLQNLDSEARKLVEDNLDYMSQECKKNYVGAVAGSEMYTFARNTSGEISIWGLCQVADGETDKTVVLLNFLFNDVSESKREINKDLILLKDGSFGYEDDNWQEHKIFSIDDAGIVQVYDINGNIISVHAASEQEKHIKAMLMLAQVEPTPTTEATAVVENIEGISTVEEVQMRIDEYLSGKEDYSIDGPNKGRLFAFPDGKLVPFSEITIEVARGEKAEDIYFNNCKQEGVYLGSIITGHDNRIITFFGSESKDSGKRVVEFFVSGFLEKPEFLPVDLTTGYASLPRLSGEKNLSWMTSSQGSLSGKDLLDKLSGNEGQIMYWLYVCDQTPGGSENFIANVTSGEGNNDGHVLLTWMFENSKNNEELFSWLEEGGDLVPKNVVTDNNLASVDWDKIPILIEIGITSESK